ncbi:MAG: hypothetical protein A3J74_07045 [Elusimicrobia bacterium RIFCSPHIGHO2_02_FULL_57_9]|nr:MAG: hypothetical protein A3J74_07045 [Elusimicrobia bacterium RIFCSPHIGHO2_02_FULL_57_9]
MHGAAAPCAGSADKAARLAALARQVNACRQCSLGSQRLNPAFGVGSPDAGVMFIGEGPGYQEDRQGEPFVGKAGRLLDKILASIGLSRRTVYIANIVKCHPMKDPGNPQARGNDRPPSPEEIAACRHFLDEQIDLILPQIIVTLGSVATRVMLGTEESITRIRGQWRTYKNIRLLPTFHPAALLRNPELKKDVWSDMKNLRKELGAPAGGNP